MPAPPCPPSADPLVAMADRCVQCGLCLPACPTYGLSRQEAESPRGRIALARAWATGALEPGPIGDAHLDHCLACRRCESACPAGVPYGALLVAARVRQRARRAPRAIQRLVEALVVRPRLLRVLLALYAALYPALPRALRRLPRPPRPTTPRRAPASRADASVFVGCVAAPYEAPLRDALQRLAQAAGLSVDTPIGQTCCGAVHAHAGDAATAAALAARNRAAFARSGTVLSLASGCRDAVGVSLGEDHDVRDALAWLDAAAPNLRFTRRDARVGLHLPCTQARDPSAVAALRRLLARVPGLVVVDLDAGFGCCGAAGTQMLTDPAQARALRAPLLGQIAGSRIDCVLSANIGCRLHLAIGLDLPVLHPLELLADAVDTPVHGDAPTPRA